MSAQSILFLASYVKSSWTERMYILEQHSQYTYARALTMWMVHCMSLCKVVTSNQVFIPTAWVASVQIWRVSCLSKEGNTATPNVGHGYCL